MSKITEIEIRWEFAKQWVLKQKPDITEPMLAAILKRFAKKEYTDSSANPLKLEQLCNAIEHDYQTFVDQEGGLKALLVPNTDNLLRLKEVADRTPFVFVNREFDGICYQVSGLIYEWRTGATLGVSAGIRDENPMIRIYQN
jgi:hypothetical protein